jgi:hypothetical protein
MTNLSKSSLEQLLSFYEARIEALERELQKELQRGDRLMNLLNRSEDVMLDYHITTTNFINSKLNG